MADKDKKTKGEIMKKLEGLYKLAILKEGEEKDETRRIEAASSALILLNMARKSGVKLKFIHEDDIPADDKKTTEKKDEQNREWWMNPLETFVTEASKRALKDIVKDLTSK